MMLLLPPPFGPATTQIVACGSARTTFHGTPVRRTQLRGSRFEGLGHRLSEGGSLHARDERVELLGKEIQGPGRRRIESLVFLDRYQDGGWTPLSFDDDSLGASNVQIASDVLFEVGRARLHGFGHA
jgi:hypothetical protein